MIKTKEKFLVQLLTKIYTRHDIRDRQSNMNHESKFTRVSFTHF